MGDLINAFRQFIARDVMYVLGGSTVLLGLLAIPGQLPQGDEPAYLTWLGVGLAYAVGHATQEAFSLTPCLTTAWISEPNTYVQKLFHRFTGQAWTPIAKDLDLSAARVTIEHKASEHALSTLDRVIALKHVGTTLGSNFVLAALLFGVSSVMADRTWGTIYSVLGLLLGIFLIHLGWLKGAQQTQMTVELYNYLSEDTNTRVSEVPE